MSKLGWVLEYLLIETLFGVVPLSCTQRCFNVHLTLFGRYGREMDVVLTFHNSWVIQIGYHMETSKRAKSNKLIKSLRYK